MLYITLDDTLYSPDAYDDIQKASFTIRRRDEDGTIAYGFSGDLTFYGDAFLYLYNTIINPPEGFGTGVNKEVFIRVYDDCCRTQVNGEFKDYMIFQGVINGASLDWCVRECYIRCQVSEYNDTTKKTDCLKSNVIWHNGYDYNGKKFTELSHPFVWHCSELRPSFMHYLWLIIGLGLNVMLLMLHSLVALVALIKEIIDAIGALFSGEAVEFDFDLLASYKDLIDQMNGYVSGCQYGHPAPLVRDYIQNICNVCGLTFSSSIFNDPASPYYNTLFFSAPTTKGKDEYVTWIADDAPIASGDTMLNWLKDTFNGDYRIENGILYFERRDYFNNGDIWLDLSNALDSEAIKICFSYPTKRDPANAEFNWMLDGVDWCGNEAKSFYNERVDWNLPFGQYARLKGTRKYQIPFSPARFRRDGVDEDVLSVWQDAWNTFGLGDYLTGGAQFSRALLLPVHMTSTPKLLIWDGTSSVQDAKIKHIPYSPAYQPMIGNVQAPNPIDPDGDYYNFDMWVSSETDSVLTTQGVGTSKPYIQGNLYDRFWYIDDPRLSNEVKLDYTATIVRDCKAIITLDFTKSVLLPNGLRGTVDEVTITDETITIKGRT